MINLNELTSHHPAFHNIVASHLPHYFAGCPQAPKPLKNDLREARKPQNYSGNNFRHARKHQTFRETTFDKSGNNKPFGKGVAGSPQIILFSPDR